MAQQAVIFDYGRVLGSPSKEWEATIERDYGIPARTWGPLANEVEASMRGRTFGSDDMLPLMTKRLLPIAGEKAGEAAMCICSVFVDPSAHALNHEFLKLMARLHQARLLLGILSNGPADSRTTTIARAAEAAMVDAVVVSGAEGVGKPAPEAFDLILSRLGVAAKDAWFVDDDAEHVAAARRSGLRAALFNGDVAGLEHELRVTGLVW